MKLSGVNIFPGRHDIFLRLLGIGFFLAEFVLNQHTVNQKDCFVWQVSVNVGAVEFALNTENEPLYELNSQFESSNSPYSVLQHAFKTIERKSRETFVDSLEWTKQTM